MPIVSGGASATIVSLLAPQPKILALVTGSIYTSGGSGGNVNITSSDGTLSVTGATNSYNIVIAQQGATANQVLAWNSTTSKWSPTTISAAPQVFSGAGAPSGITPTVSSAIYYDTTSTAVYEWINNAWVLASSSSGGANYLYQLRDVTVQETGGSFGTNQLSPPAVRIVGYTDTQLQVSSILTVNIGDRLASQNTNPSATLVVTNVSSAGQVQTISFASGVFSTWAPSGTLIQAIYIYTPTTLPANRALVWSGSTWADAAIVNSVAVNGGGTVSQGSVNFVNGTNTTVVRNPDGSIQINSQGGGGGGSFSSAAATWASGGTAKNAFVSPGTINNQGIVINLVAAGGSGQITNATVSLNGSPLGTTYSSSGSFPNYTITVPVGDVTGNAAQTANSVTVSVSGTFNSGNFNVSAGTLTNNQPVAFTSTLTGSYVETSLAYYNNLATLNYSYTNSNQITSFGGTFVPTQTPLLPRNATSPSGQFTNIDSRGCTITGSVIGNGLNGAAAGVTIGLSGSVAAVPSYVPAFFVITSTSATPTFTTSSSQTTGAAQGSMVNYPLATAGTNYAWLATQRPLANIAIATFFGNIPYTPDLGGATGAITQVIGGQTFNLYAVTNLSLVAALQLVIS